YGKNSGKTTNIGISDTQMTNISKGESVSDTNGSTYTSTDGSSETKGISHGRSSSITETEGSLNVLGKVGKSGGLAMRLLSKSPQVRALSLVCSVLGSTNSTQTQSGESYSESYSNTISRTLSHGINESRTIGKNQSTSTGNSKGRSYGEGTSVGESYSVSDSVNFSTSKTLSDTLGKSQGITLNARNLSLQSTVERLEKQLKRIEECESFGMWNFAAYFIGEGASDTVSAANVYRSVVSGVQSGIECSAINTWTADEDLKRLSPYIKNFIHPSFRYVDGKRYTDVSPAVLISTKELTIHMGLPYHSVKGLPVIEHAVFAQEVLSGASKEAKKEIDLGNIYHLGDTTDTRVKLDLESLTMHTFITGSTGSGKSNTVYKLLSEAKKHKIPFLVVEPAKGEYRNEFPSVQCFGTNPRIGDILQLNPFAFPEGIHVLEHIDRLVEIFNVCWPMEAAMPSVLKESIEKAYVKVGWDMDASINILGDNKFPSFTDVDSALNETIKASKYSAEVKGNYIGSLSTRLKSLTNGINGRLFTKTEMDLSKLFDESAILDLSRIGSMETKAFIMGIVVLKLQEYRMSNRNGMNENLKHLTILEEAHNLLKKLRRSKAQVPPMFKENR
ncbi:MAG: DUF87 domain-containing protein, partial [Selenomonadaceae bacterium]|nr:DUF87 domain-containing protein [Selenomonadaceae bacterium]